MSRVVEIIKTLRTHWKKTTFVIIIAGYGVNYGNNKMEVQQMMKSYCLESKRFGESALPVGVKPRHVTVLLNPAAKDGKGPALYEKYAAPLLHLAGIRVSIFKTEHEGEVKTLMDVMDNTDAVLVAGGDGTLLETVTGLCRRNDADTATQRLPIGVLPVGRTNTLATNLFWGDHHLEAKLLAESAMAIVRGKTRPMNVMSIQAESGKPVFALASLEWGIYRDVSCKIQNYWYWGPLKAKMAYIFAALKKMVSHSDAELWWTPPCDGCSKCCKPPSSAAEQSDYSASGGRRWWHSFIPRSSPRNTVTPIIDYSQINNEDCGHWSSVTVSTTDLQIVTNNVLPNCSEDEKPASLKVKTGPKEIGRVDFIREGWRRAIDSNKNDNEWGHVIAAKEVKIEPKFAEGSDSWFSIDREDHEAKPIHIRLLPKNIYVFFGASQ